MTCIKDWLAAYYDNELDAAHRQRLQAHLAECADCQGELARLQALSAALAVDEIDTRAIADASVVWSTLRARLPERLATTAGAAAWLPGVGLVVLNGLLQAVGVISLLVVLVTPQPQAAWISNLINGVFHRSGWLLPGGWKLAGAFLYSAYLSMCLAMLYLAWLSYMWRYRWHAAAHRFA